MDKVKMLISSVVTKGDRKIVRVSFLQGKSCADGLLPEGIIERSEGFSDDEVVMLENYLRANRRDILEQAKKVNPLRSWLMS